MEISLDYKLVSVEQLIIFLKVIEEGSFLKAAKALNRAQGGVSYNITAMEEILGFPLFDRSDKRPKLNEAGKIIEIEAREILKTYQSLVSRSEGIRKGLEPSFSITFDIIFPNKLQVELIKKFKKAFPTVVLNIRSGILYNCLEDLYLNRSKLSVTGKLGDDNGLSFVPCGRVQLIPLAHKDHPLAKLNKVPDKKLNLYKQILLTDNRVDEKNPTDFKIYPNAWRVNDVRTRNSLLMGGLGWSRAPLHQVEEEVKRKELIPILKNQWPKREMQAKIMAAHKRTEYQGPVMKWWLNELSKFKNRVFE